MRIGLLTLWLRAAVQHRSGRATSLRYAGGIALLEGGWLSRLLLGESLTTLTFLALAGVELLVPVWAERAAPTSWHPHHIAERYSLFAIILLGESIFAATTAVVAVVEEGAGRELVVVSIAELVIVAGLWWLYFVSPAGADLEARREWSFVWGYGHYAVFAALAALAAGLEVVVSASAGHSSHLGVRGAVAAVAIPVALALTVLELVQVPAAGSSPRIDLSTAVAVAALGAVVVLASHLGLVAGVCLVAGVLVGAVLAQDIEPARWRALRKETT
jgi:low temperature requirement protein LtrA